MQYVEIFGLWVLKATMLGILHMKAIHGQVTYRKIFVFNPLMCANVLTHTVCNSVHGASWRVVDSVNHKILLLSGWKPLQMIYRLDSSNFFSVEEEI